MNPDWKNIPIVRIDDPKTDMPHLGGMFFSAAYLIVNHDRNEFTIAPAHQKPATQKLVAVDTASNCVAEDAKPNATSVIPPTSSNSSESRSLAGGAIAGIVVGVIAGLCIVAIVAFLAWRRRRRSTEKHRMPEVSTTYGGYTEDRKYSATRSELAAGHGLRELESSERSPVELPGGDQIFTGRAEGNAARFGR